MVFQTTLKRVVNVERIKNHIMDSSGVILKNAI
nr:MAG TPA: hypothetical protein [Crassvirales sp.]